MESPGAQALIIAVQSEDMELAGEVRDAVEGYRKSLARPEAVEIVRVDPKDPTEKDFLEQFRVSSETKVPTTILMAANPWRIAGIVPGGITRGRIAAILQAARAEASSSCG